MLVLGEKNNQLQHSGGISWKTKSKQRDSNVKKVLVELIPEPNAHTEHYESSLLSDETSVTNYSYYVSMPQLLFIFTL